MTLAEKGMKPPQTRTDSRRSAPGRLHNGDRMTQAEFHRLYQQYPEDKKFELVGGVVYMASPLYQDHGTSHPELGGVFWFYKAFTPGVELADNMTTVLGEKEEPQPDLMLRILTEYGGQSRYDQKQCLTGPPELIAEVSHSSRSIDMTAKRDDYLRAGVQEYLVVCTEEERLHWFHFPSRRKLKPGRDGVWKSRVFPGLWVDEPALHARDSARLLATIQRGVAAPEHAAFVEKLRAARRS
jgi:hypothetical protein